MMTGDTIKVVYTDDYFKNNVHNKTAFIVYISNEKIYVSFKFKNDSFYLSIKMSKKYILLIPTKIVLTERQIPNKLSNGKIYNIFEMPKILLGIYD